MTVSRADVVRHFLKSEASHPKYKDRRDELFSWCESPDDVLLQKAKILMHERPDTNPALLYTVGDRAHNIASWSREKIECRQIYTCGIADAMRSEINIVSGNMCEFAARFSANYAEFSDRSEFPRGDEAILIIIAKTKPGRNGCYELVDGAHRLVALCKAKVGIVESYVGKLAKQ